MKIGDQILDSRNIQERIDELDEELQNIKDDLYAALGDDSNECIEEFSADITKFFNSDEGKELKQLLEMKEEVDSCEWDYGLTLIHANYWADYVEELAKDIGAVESDVKWPYNHIDWEAAADELEQDYSTVDIGDHMYYYRDC